MHCEIWWRQCYGKDIYFTDTGTSWLLFISVNAGSIIFSYPTKHPEMHRMPIHLAAGQCSSRRGLEEVHLDGWNELVFCSSWSSADAAIYMCQILLWPRLRWPRGNTNVCEALASVRGLEQEGRCIRHKANTSGREQTAEEGSRTREAKMASSCLYMGREFYWGYGCVTVTRNHARGSAVNAAFALLRILGDIVLWSLRQWAPTYY